MAKKDNKWINKLYFGDNLDILRDKIPNNCIDLIYLDPPFQSGRTYNIIFQPEVNNEVKGATAQIKTFEDTWKWGEEAEKNYEGLINGTITKDKPKQKLIDLMKSMRDYLGECSMMAYLSMMAPRLFEMNRVLKDTGSIYLHCDPTSSHYLKLLMDAIFGVINFRNEIIWHYKRWSNAVKMFQRMHDVILYYTKTKNYFYNIQYQPYSHPEWVEDTVRGVVDGKLIRLKDDKGNYIQRKKANIGVPIHDVWEDINFIGPTSQERVGYPTQKPEALLERIIKASSKEGDLVLDPFCGCGTALAIAESLERKWIGIDITYLAIDVISKRLRKNGIRENVDFEIDGEPKDNYSAKKLVEKDPFQFQIWCISKLDATPSETKSADKGVDGIINFYDPRKSNKVGKGIIQVKGTKSVNPSMVRDLKGTLKSQDADFGILIIFRKPTQGMINEATKEKYFKFAGRDIPKIQFLTVDDLFKDPIPIKLPFTFIESFKKPIIDKKAKKKTKKMF
jgi:site-specific DNA-methyltransferase (adenine-specific)